MALAFDRVVITAHGVETSLSLADFLGLPLNERLRAVFEKRLQFYRDDQRVEAVLALQSLREQAEPGRTRR